MILFKPELIVKIRACRYCGHDFLRHTYDADLGVPVCGECEDHICAGPFVGQKFRTRRYWKSPRAKVGALHNVNVSYMTWTGIRIRILRCELDLYHWTEDDAIAEGFDNLDEFRDYFAKINKNRMFTGRMLYVVDFAIEGIVSVPARAG